MTNRTNIIWYDAWPLFPTGRVVSSATLIVLLAILFTSQTFAQDIPDVMSPVVSYQYYDSLGEDNNTTVISPIVSYQYFDCPDTGSVQFINSPLVSYYYPFLGTPTLIVTPSTTTAYGSLLVGNTRDQTFTVFNVGTSTISGTVSVALPFSVVGGGSYTLAPGQFINKTIRYVPTAAGNNSAYVMFTGSGDQTRRVTGSVYTDPTSTTGSIVGRVTRASDNSPMNGVIISVVRQGADLLSVVQNQTVTGVKGGQAGVFSVSGLRPNTHYTVTAIPPIPLLLDMATNVVPVVAGETTTVNLALPSIAPPPMPTLENTPVVLVRGAQPVGPIEWPDNSWLPLKTMWQNSSQLLDPNLLWDCNKDIIFIDGTKSIELNSAMLSEYIRVKAIQYKSQRGYYPPQIDIVAHSMGGLITRRAMGHIGKISFTDPVDIDKLISVKVDKVIMLGTPNAGSPLADMPLADIWSAIWSIDVIHDSKTTYVNNTFNPAYPWPSGVSLYLYAGTNGYYSGDRNLCLGAALLGSPITDPFCSPWSVNDGVVPRPSVSGTKYCLGVNTLWAHINNFNPSPVEDYNDYEIIGRRIDHYSLMKDPAILNYVIATLTGVCAPPVTQSAKSLLAIQAKEMDANSTNLLPMQQIEEISSMLSSGQVNSASVISDAATTLSFQLLAHATDEVFGLHDPVGTVIDSTTPSSNSNVQYSAMIADSNLMLITYTISNPATGTWQTVLDGGSMSETQASCLVRVFGDSTVSLLPQTIPPCNQGQDVVVSCSLADFNTNPAMPVVNSSITATIQLPDDSNTNLTLFDDGWHNDGEPNDGVYGAVLTNMQQAGTYSITYRATGTNGQGRALQRVATGGFSVSSGHGSLWGDPVYESVDTNGDGIADFLEVKCWVNPTADGNYILVGDLVDANGTYRLSKSAAFAADGNWPTMVTLIFDLTEMGAGDGQDTYHIENLQLFEVTSTGTAWLDAYQGSSVVNIVVNFADFALFANHWLYQNCVEPDWCEGTDFDKSGNVDMLDLAEFAKYWLSGF